MVPPFDDSAWAVFEVFAQDVYGIQELELSGVGTVIDIGANIGTFVLAALERWPQARVRAFEPGALAFSQLIKNVDENRLTDRVTCVNKAVVGGDMVSEVQFFESKAASIVNTTVPESAVGDGEWRRVPAVSLSAVLAECEAIPLMKIDIEGGEYDLLLNTDEAALSAVQQIILEYHPSTQHDWTQLSEYLASAGFTIRRLKQMGPGLGIAWFVRS